MLSTR
ncbi:hypothetical protein CP8484711_1055A, partial [Chlamydia psittaci 84-8471/1]